MRKIQAKTPVKPLRESLRESQSLLHQMLPPHVAEALREGRKVEPEYFKAVTIFFSDIVGFTDISSSMGPTKVMSMLDRLYQELDNITRKYGLFKVETIGDAYMCVGGLPEPQDNHTARVARFALDAVRAANGVLIDEENPDAGYVQIRAGFHSGPVVASVVGDLNPRYCLFGDSVNTASRMESNSRRNKINLSASAWECLQEQAPATFKYAKRGELNIKGKGFMQCYFLLDRAEGNVGSEEQSDKSFSFGAQPAGPRSHRISSSGDTVFPAAGADTEDTATSGPPAPGASSGPELVRSLSSEMESVSVG